MQNTTILNLNRFELRQVKNAFNSNNASYKKLDKLFAKVRELGTEIETLQGMIDAWEAPIKQMTAAKYGVELTSREVLLSYENPEEFLAKYPDFVETENAEEEEGSSEEPAQETEPEFPTA